MKKVLVVFLVLLFLFLVPSKVLAQRQLGVGDSIVLWGNKAILGCSEEMDQTLGGGMSLEQWVGGTCEGEVKGTKVQGAIPATGKLIAGLYTNQPVSSVTYLADLGQNLGLVKPAYAQGTGFAALEPVLKLWKAFRNVAYLLMVIVMVVVGFLIMLRKQINPQTVISIQNALPRIVVTLLLITFSYAIAGLMIDLIYVLIYLVVGIFKFGGDAILTKDSPALDMLLDHNLFGLFYSGAFIAQPAKMIGNLIYQLFAGADIFTRAIGTVLGLGASGLVHLILAIAFLYCIFKLFFALLLSYVGIVLSVIMAPIQLLLNAFPGSNSFSSWFKNLAANILVFPAVALLFLIAAALMGPTAQAGVPGGPTNTWGIAPDVGYSGTGGPGWVPPFLRLVGEGGATADSIMALIGLGIILLMHKIPEMVKQAMGVEGGVAGLAGAAMEPVGFAGRAGAWGATGAFGAYGAWRATPGWEATRRGRILRRLYAGWRGVGGQQVLKEG